MAYPSGRLGNDGARRANYHVVEPLAGCCRCASPACSATRAYRLTGAGLHPDQPTVWLLEGLLIYLTAGPAGQLLTGGELRRTTGQTPRPVTAAASPVRPLAASSPLPALDTVSPSWKAFPADARRSSGGTWRMSVGSAQLLVGWPTS
jgi:hypothetical protein